MDTQLRGNRIKKKKALDNFFIIEPEEKVPTYTHPRPQKKRRTKRQILNSVHIDDYHRPQKQKQIERPVKSEDDYELIEQLSSVVGGQQKEKGSKGIERQSFFGNKYYEQGSDEVEPSIKTQKGCCRTCGKNLNKRRKIRTYYIEQVQYLQDSQDSESDDFIGAKKAKSLATQFKRIRKTRKNQRRQQQN